MFKSIIKGIRNLWAFRKVVWSDRDWDWVFLITLLHLKLERMESYYRLNGVAEDHIKTADEIKVVKDAAHRIITNDYYDIALKPHHEKYGEDYEEMIYKPASKNTVSLSWVKKSTTMTDKEYEEARADKMASYELSDKMLVDDINLLFDYMKANLQKWWD